MTLKQLQCQLTATWWGCVSSALSQSQGKTAKQHLPCLSSVPVPHSSAVSVYHLSTLLCFGSEGGGYFILAVESSPLFCLPHLMSIIIQAQCHSHSAGSGRKLPLR